MGFMRLFGWLLILVGVFFEIDFFFLGYLNINAPFVGQIVIGLILIFIGYFFVTMGRKGPAHQYH